MLGDGAKLIQFRWEKKHCVFCLYKQLFYRRPSESIFHSHFSLGLTLSLPLSLSLYLYNRMLIIIVA